jgi:hypothetical protein
MTTPSDTVRSLLRRLGVAGPARLDVSRGTRAPSANTTSASKISLLVSLTATAAFFALTGTALAAPEAPLTEPAQSVTATTAVLHGVLNPATKAKAGWYFEYSTELTCENGLKTPRHPEEEVQARSEADVVQGLEPGRTYTYCLVASVETEPGSEVYETTQSPIEKSFTTLGVAPTVEGEYVSGVQAAEATLNAQINPNNEKTKYFFEYSTSKAEVLAGKGTPVAGAGELEGSGGQRVSVSTGAVLTPGTTYYYRAIAQNVTSEETKGEIKSFTAALAAAPEAPEALKPSSIFATAVTLHGVLDPNIASGTPTEALDYEFVYRETNEKTCRGAGEVTTTQGFSTGTGREEASQQVTGLKPSSEYAVCLLAHNSSNLSEETASPPVTFKTAAAVKPEAPEATEVSERKATGAIIYGIVNPDTEGEPGSYRFVYRQNPTECTGEHAVETAEEPASGTSPDHVEVAIGGLQAGKPYTFCVEAFNALGEATLSAPRTFVTAIAPETPTGVEAKPIGASTVTLLGTLNPSAKGEAGTYEFLYKNVANGPGCEGESQTPVSVASGAQGELAKAEVSGLEPGKPYTFCLRAGNETGYLEKELGENGRDEETVLSGPVTFTTLPVAAPAIEAQFTTDLASTSVTLHATVNPEGAATTYAFEYAQAGEEFKPVSEPAGHGSGSIPAGAAPVPIAVHVQEGLQANTTYQFRVKVRNSAEEVTPEPVSFTTEPSGAPFVLPDNRGYEMVTPVQKNGTLFKPLGAGPIRAAASGDGIVDVASVPTENEPQGESIVPIAVLSGRGSSGWSSRTISAPHPEAGPTYQEHNEYQLFSEDLSAAVADPFSAGFEQLSPLATEPTPYLQTLLAGGNPAEPCEASYTSAASCFTPLVSASDDTHVPLLPFGELHASGECALDVGQCGPFVEAGTPDLSHLVLSSPVPLTATPAPTGTPLTFVQPDLYEYSAGALQLISVLPGQHEGSLQLHVAGSEGLGSSSGEAKGQVAVRHAISDDGDRVVLEKGAVENAPGGGVKERTGLYLRDVAKGETIRLDEPDPGMEASVNPEYMTANSEGSRIFFLDSAKLTADSAATHGRYLPTRNEHYRQFEDRPDLYECAISEVDGKDKCTLTDLTPETSGESASVAMVLGSSEDGSYVYFAAAGGLGIAPHGGCSGGEENPAAEALEEHVPGSALCNVYVRHDGVTKLVARLSQHDAADWVTNQLRGSTVRVSPNGEWLAFLSHRSITGYDNSRAEVPSKCEVSTGPSGKVPGPCQEVYLYDSGTGGLSCASCDPTGQRPAGGASVPGWTGTWSNGYEAKTYFQPRYLSNEGRVFFDSPDALVEKDVSKQSEVYEYEPQGVPSGEHACSSSSSSGSEVYKPATGEEGAGCVALISTGTAAEGSTFMEASETGADVFFLTTEKALPQDVDTAPDVYDAHECTTASPCISVASAPEQCTTEASCKAPPTPQPTIYAPPPSATFNGPGNITPEVAPPPKKVTTKTVKCKKGFVKNKKNKCVKKPKKKKTKARKSSNKGRA